LEEKRKRKREGHSSAPIFLAWSVSLEAVLNVPEIPGLPAPRRKGRKKNCGHETWL